MINYYNSNNTITTNSRLYFRNKFKGLLLQNEIKISRVLDLSFLEEYPPYSADDFSFALEVSL